MDQSNRMKLTGGTFPGSMNVMSDTGPRSTHTPGAGPSLAILAGYWSTNIGNAFFQLGAEYLLKQVCPEANVVFIGDQPGYWNTEIGNPPNALDYAAHVKCDALVILGPFMRPEMEKITAKAMRACHERGGKIIVLAAGMMKYDKDTVALARRLLKETPPFIFTTRDRETYELYADLAEHAFDGVDVATFVSDLYRPLPHDLPEYVLVNFDQIPEPDFVNVPALSKARKNITPFEWNGKVWEARQPAFRTEMSYRARTWPFVEAFLPLPKRPDTIDGFPIVRTDHRYNPFLPRKTYRWPRSFVSDIPHTYLALYAHTRCTFSNRVHACVATASYGNEAMLFTRSPRAYLLNRLGLTTIKEKPTKIDLDFLRREKANYRAWLGEKLKLLTPKFGVANVA